MIVTQTGLGAPQGRSRLGGAVSPECPALVFPADVYRFPTQRCGFHRRLLTLG